MENKLQSIAVFFGTIHFRKEEFINKKICKSDTTKIFSILFVVFLIAIWLAISADIFPVLYRILFIIVYTLTTFIILTLTSVRFRYLKFINNSQDLNINAEVESKKSLNLENYIAQESYNNFDFLTKGKQPSDKINFIGSNKNKKAANYHQLFTISEHFIYENLTRLSAKKGFNLLNSNFILNGNEIFFPTFESRFSSWKTEKNQKKLQEREDLLKEILG